MVELKSGVKPDGEGRLVVGGILGEEEKRKDALESSATCIVVQGPAGCGKSTFASKLVNKTVTADETLVLLCGMLNSTRVRMEQSLRMEGIAPEKTSITTIHALMFDLVGRHRAMVGLSADYLLGIESDGGILDFTVIERAALTLLDRFPSIVEAYGRKFGIIVVDEFQDLNSNHYAFVKKLSLKTRLIVLGDRRQAVLDDGNGSSFDPLAEIESSEGIEIVELGYLVGQSRFRNQDLAKLEEALRLKSQQPIPYCADIQVRTFFANNQREVLAKDIVYKLLKKKNSNIAVIASTRAMLRDLKRLMASGVPSIYARYVTPPHEITSVYKGLEAMGMAVLGGGSEEVSGGQDVFAYCFQERVTNGAKFQALIKKWSEEAVQTRVKETASNSADVCETVQIRLRELREALSVEYPNQSSALDFAYEVAKRALDGMAILNPVRVRETMDWKRWIAKRFRARLNTASDADSDKPGRVYLMTIAQAKNRQFDEVIFVIEKYGRVLPEGQTHSQLYVACTRARRKLTVYRPTVKKTDDPPALWKAAEPYLRNCIVPERTKVKQSSKGTKRA